MTDDKPGPTLTEAKAAMADIFAHELRLYRGYVAQFDKGYDKSRLFKPLELYDALIGIDYNTEAKTPDAP